MDRGNVHDPTRGGSAPGLQNAAGSELGFGQTRPPEEMREQHGRVATMVKGAFKIYLVPAMRARNALATVTGGWSDLVAEARQEHETRKQPYDLKEPDVETGELSAATRLTPAISPPHVTSGVVAHLPPEVRHKLAGDGPIRA